jgi:hypothetical protein
MQTHPLTLDEKVRCMRLVGCAQRVRLVNQNARRGMAEVQALLTQ